MANIKLEPDQKPHVARMFSILKSNVGCGDTSPCGAGKTITTLKLFKMTGLKKLFIVCPNSLKTKWKLETSKYGIDPIDIINYERLAGRKTGCSHKWITRNGNKYAASDEFTRITKNGVLLVFDEVQYVKNSKSSRSMAAFALVKAVANRTVSRTCFLSNTPLDKSIFANSIVRILGIVTRDKMYYLDRVKMKYILQGHGISQLMKYCRRIDNNKVDYIKKKYPIDNTNVKTIPFHLYNLILKHKLVSSMPAPSIQYKLSLYNSFYRMSEKSIEKIREGYNLLRGYTINRDDNERIHSFGTLSSAQGLIEQGKLIKIKNVVLGILNEDQNIKIIIYLHRTKSMHKIVKYLEDFGALLMNFEVTGQDRDDVIKKFQNNTNENRVLITSSMVGGVGLDLDDQTGEHPREVYIIPGFKYIDDYQGARRVMRRYTKSDAKVNYVYCSEFPNEKVLLNQIKKSKIHKDSVSKDKDMLEVVKHIEWYEYEEDRQV
uniref:DEAD/SNF2-like helicase n=1 Tax=Pithovirus LCPAC001 TaxID=2506585 RepID=A0A481Z1Q9_9VIRU|nr:MAG: DEAD/SNF2-like helicase [Pithovirus LCPAC001]